MRAIALSIVLILISATAYCQAVKDDELRKSIYFRGGSYYIDDIQIAELFNWLDSIPKLTEKYQIQLISHTDPIGGKQYNEWLSQMRGESVHELLLQKSIPETIIYKKDWGLENPVYSNESFRGMMMNRRVDVILHPIVF
ncbi:MAG: OmpA family protein [Bacteroidia bacterium]|nr:OmpA family protein [Bacteroidia bacterium]